MDYVQHFFAFEKTYVHAFHNNIVLNKILFKIFYISLFACSAEAVTSMVSLRRFKSACQFNDENNFNDILNLLEFETTEEKCKILQEVLPIASEFSMISIFQGIIKNGVSINKPDTRGNYAIHYAALSKVDAMEKVSLSYANNKDCIHWKGSNERTPLCLASEACNSSVVEFFLERIKQDYSQDALSEHLTSVLLETCSHTSFEIVDSFVTYGAKLNIRDAKGFYLIHHACLSHKDALKKSRAPDF